MITIMLTHIQNLPHNMRIFRKGQYLFHQGDPIVSMFLIESGEARLIRRQRNGGVVVLQRALAASCLAEASLFKLNYHCDAIAMTRVSARLVSKSAMRKLFERDREFAEAWAHRLADEVQNARLRAEILSYRTVAERFQAWVAATGRIPKKGTWKSVAQDIGTSPEALYREIARRRS